ncbi:thiamine pyrophosphate-dependent dehydrogenase E1 component subunit alpha [Paraburkholderia madseniana]|uniref:Thiamine pyrophosphate-dependent dehydrogenase E1 component subunit alpha n=1 Tax=Paraburkholderia madseniana TaxID=2599607 RepID=A0A6N6WLJ9_9BURK|nr:thiamine pyrophosphate-dependent dehydrogenase E1 component subunit alpha [Paraburkholderia madseniana]KAE8761353.1 thiamine pyrophosphate-dependent dehydrogenase E1 component subunit alpha [Paraburkholderia madseniana]NPT65158.1 thiamine pyrophosphate-dependent dehydrogenase E1 component subunit alpha [Paraburkholderia madseniana]
MKVQQPPSSEVLIDIYRRMTLIKQNDERFRAVIKSGKLVMPYYSPRGQEAIPSAVSVCLSNDDYICTIYRGVHDMIAKGVPLKDLWAELGGRVTGTCKGKGGPMHVTHPASGVMVTTGIVGSSMPIANGLALAAQIRGEPRVAVAYFGDGAANIGAFHESLNMASVWKLPVVFVCQNNGYAEHTKYAYGTSVPNIAQRAAAYQMPGITVDGNDPIAMHRVAREAIERARDGGGPTLIEANTFRFHGHVFGDPDAYMDEHEKAAWVAKDPVPLFRAWLIAAKHATEAQLAEMEAAHNAEIDAAVEFALTSAYPEVAELRRDIFKDEVPA